MSLRLRARELGLALGVFLVALSAIWSVRQTRHEDGLYTDEPEWIAISILHWRQFVLGEPPAGAELDPPEEAWGTPWRRGVQRTTFGYMNPCVPKLVWGACLFAAGHRAASPLAFTLFTRDEPERRSAEHEAMEGAVPLARRVVLVACALSITVFVFAVRRLARGARGWSLAALAGTLLVASPLVRNTATYLRTDWFMVVPAMLAFAWVLARHGALGGAEGPRARLRSALVLGLLSGLAVSSKLSGAMVGMCVAVWAVVAWVAHASERDLRSFLRGPVAASLLAGFVCALVFYALNPRLWGEPIAGVRDILERWDTLLTYFQDEIAQRRKVTATRTLGERSELFAARSLGRDDPWRALTGLPGGGLLAVCGAAALAWRARGLLRREAAAVPAALALVFCAITVVTTALWIPLDWERFFLTAAPAHALLIASALFVPLELARRAD
ncbi:MAG TPA: hypothetical protein VMT18_00665 [Planctomycetota bacterium]|nr:hypothetical protein [Planctomycetota bacterium]